MRKREWSLDQIMDQAIALTVPCRDCGEPSGKKCSKTDWRGVTETLDNLPAHARRIKDARRVQAELESDELADQWEVVPAAEMFVSRFRGRTVEIAGVECSFVGTSPGPDGALTINGERDGTKYRVVVPLASPVRVKAVTA